MIIFFNKSILENDAFYFISAEEITELLNKNIDRCEFKFKVNNNAEKIKHQYSWKHIIDLLENFLIQSFDESINTGK